LLGLGGLVAVERAQVRLHGGSRRERASLEVVDDLRDDVLARAGDDEARTLRRTLDFLATADLAALTRRDAASGVLGVLDRDCHGLLTSLSGLAQDALARVTHALALVGLRLADLADVGCDLTHGLLVDARHGELGRALDGERDALGRRERHRVAEAEVALDLRRALGEHAVTDAHDLELLLVALGDTDDHVVDQRAREAVKGLAATLVVRTLDRERAVIVLADGDGLGDS